MWHLQIFVFTSGMKHTDTKPAAFLTKSPQWLGSAQLSICSLWSDVLSGGTLRHEALYCLSRLGLIKENEPGDFGTRCLIKNQHCTNAISIATRLWNRWMTGALCCNSAA